MSDLILVSHRGVVQSVGHVEPMNQPWLDQLRVFVTDLLVQRKPEVGGVGVEHKVRVLVDDKEALRFVENAKLGKGSLEKVLRITKLPHPNTFHEI